jgi:MFS transporter, ACS family, glucarate transporter
MASAGKLPIRALLVFGLFLLSTVAYLDRTNISIAGLQISQEYGFNNVRLGWLASAFLMGYAVSQVPAGWLAVRYGPRRMLTFGLMWWGVFTALTTVVPTGSGQALMLLLVLRFSLGVGEAIMYPASSQLVARWIPQRERGIANGWIFAGVGAGAGLTPPLLAWIIGRYGWRASFWFSALVGVAAGAIWYWFARDTPQQHPLVTKDELRTIEEGIGKGTEKERDETPLNWWNLFRSKAMCALTLSYFSYGYVAWVFFAWFYIYLQQERHLDMRSSAVYSMFPFLAMTVFSALGGLTNDRITATYGSRAGRCGVGAVALAVTSVLLWFGPALKDAHAASLVLAGGAGMLYFSQSSYWSVAVDIAGSKAGLSSGLMNMGAQIGGATTASLTPWIAKQFGWNASFRVSAALALLGALLWLLVDPQKKIFELE